MAQDREHLQEGYGFKTGKVTPLSVGVVSYHACIRAHKMAWSMLDLGHHIHLLSNFVAGGHSWNTYTSSHRFECEFPGGRADSRQLRNEVRLLDKYVDVWHVHNEPNWLFRVVKEEATKPIIFDIHDWTTLRQSAPIDPMEVEDEKLVIRRKKR